MVIEIVIDVPGSGVRRCKQRRDSKSELAEVIPVVAARARVGDDRGMNVIEEASPLVVDEDEHAPLPLWSAHERGVQRFDEALIECDVALRMVVRAERTPREV